MDSDWMNRAGIAAAFVSFFMVAPEFLGSARLTRFEETIEGLLDRMNNRASAMRELARSLRRGWLRLPRFASGRGRTAQFATGVLNLSIRLVHSMTYVSGSFLISSFEFVLAPLVLAIRIPRLLLMGEGRLRTLIFVVGVMLFIAGTALQLAATF